MKGIYRHLLKNLREKRGVTVIMVTLSLLVIVGVATFAVDIGYMLMAKNQLQNVADAAALASTRQLGSIYEAMTYQAQLAYVCNPSDILPTTDAIAAEHKVAAEDIFINPSDVTIGQWDAENTLLTPTLDQPDAVKVIVRRDSSANGPVSSFFGRILGINAFNISAVAIAALTSQKTTVPTNLPLPIGISKEWFPGCDKNIKMYPTGVDSCCGWHTYEKSPSSASTLSDIIGDLTAGKSLKGNYIFSDEIIAGETAFDFTGGTIESVLFHKTKTDFEDLFQAMKVKNDGILDRDNDSNTWTTGVIVYDPLNPGCANPNTKLIVTGFATVTITNVDKTNKTIWGKVDCEMTTGGRGGGYNYGTKGSIPGLVK